MKVRTFFCAVMLSVCLYAEAAESDAQAGPQAPEEQTVKPDPAAEQAARVAANPPMTVGDKFRYHFRKTFDFATVTSSAFGAGLDQWRNHPSNWGHGWEGYGKRCASHWGQNAISHQIMFAVQAADGETPHHFHSKRHGIWPRARDALIYTVVAQRADGSLMPAYSRFFADYGSAAISRQWFPDRFHTAEKILGSGTSALAVDAGVNVFREFLPDLRSLIHH